VKTTTKKRELISDKDKSDSQTHDNN